MKAPRDSYAIALLFFNLGARFARACVCVGVLNATPSPLYLR